mgnify:CR=1 FL=1
MFLSSQSCASGASEEIFEQYQELHRRILNDTPYDKQRFLYFTASDSGLGNRMQALTSAFLVALLTDRALVVHWKPHVMSGADIDDLFLVCDLSAPMCFFPFQSPISTIIHGRILLLQPPGFDWSSDKAFNAMATKSTQETEYLWVQTLSLSLSLSLSLFACEYLW